MSVTYDSSTVTYDALNVTYDGVVLGGGAIDLSVFLNPQKRPRLTDRLLEDGPEPLGYMTEGDRRRSGLV